jgi:hypothetical protein
MKGMFNASRNVFFFGLILVCLTDAAAVGVKAQEIRMIGGVGITLFDRSNFQGQAVTFRENVPNLANRGFNDRATSLRVGPGEQWEVCVDANYRGNCIVVSGEESDLGRNGWNNRISSLRRLGGNQPPPTSAYLVLFSGPRYTGNPTNYNSARSSISKAARSVTIAQGTWMLCDGVRYTGRCITLTQSVPDLFSYDIGRVIRSVRPIGIVPPGPFPPVTNPYMVLFDRTNYRGISTNYNTSRANISVRARSVTIGRGTWEICDGSNFTGRCETLRQSVPNLRIYNIGNVIRSVRPVGP